MKEQMGKANPDGKGQEYNSIVTVLFIVSLVIVRIAINQYKYLNIAVAWVNFMGMLYTSWRIYYQVKAALMPRAKESSLFKNQLKSFRRSSARLFCLAIILMLSYSFLLTRSSSLYSAGGCINDIISLWTLLLSIEDGKIATKLTEYYRHS